MLNYCFHSHTYRCGHAQGKEEDYVISAIENGYKKIGISDHVFLPNIHMPGIRADVEELDDYISTVNSLKEKYKDKIEIYLGFEAEYSPFLMDYYKSLFENKKIDYLILGQHLHFTSATEFTSVFGQKNPKKVLKKYAKDVIDGIKSGYFSYVAHPDIIVRIFKKPCKLLTNCFKKICKTSCKYDVPLEINLNGSRISKLPESVGLFHPYEEFFRTAKKYNCKVIIGIDAHNPKYFSHKESGENAGFELIKKLDLNYIGDNLIFKTH